MSTTDSSPDFRRLLALLATLAGLLAGLGQTARHIGVTDFPLDMIIYREGVRAFLSGGEMYSVPMFAGDIALPFIYPPFGALVMVPLTTPGWMDNDLAGNIMIAMSNGLILACLRLIAPVLLPHSSALTRWAAAAVTWSLVLTFEPVDLNNGFAQINIVLMALVMWDLIPRQRRVLPQGILVGIAAAIKLTPLAFGLYFLIRRDIRSLLVTAASAVVCTLLAALVRFDATVEFYFSTLLGMGTSSDIGVDTTYQSNSSYKGMIMRFAPDGAAVVSHDTLTTTIWLVLVLITIGLGGWLMVALLRRGRELDAVLVNAVIMLLVSPVSWSHHWVWLVFVLPVFAFRALAVKPVPRALVAVLGVWAVLLVTKPPKWWFGDQIDLWALQWWQTILVSDYVWLGLAFMVALALSLRGQRSLVAPLDAPQTPAAPTPSA
ncbi:glycosyltransferase 87 family protein [Corynebacterium uterequi]|uniref:Putative DUF2029 family protein n=1 Tax=Corynebacterium uterequi TaxID=1072256 RepID=A0A0G3HIG5_9CORY|nr:glycosyltransferase 87 family protein [Corynebacterium uterequi]AKK10942.1 putative DUF2029 family protein [Corynebacterium uterequi]